MVRGYIKHNGAFKKHLHFGCGQRVVDGWLNVDVTGSEINIDFSTGKLPFPSNYFSTIVSQHVIEHLDLKSELLPNLKDFYRILEDNGEVYLSCPSMQKICEAYVNDEVHTLLNARRLRWPDFSLNGYPDVQMINHLFHQDGEHKNLFDFNLLSYVLEKCGFSQVQEITESTFLQKHPSFPIRNDDEQSLYICARK